MHKFSVPRNGLAVPHVYPHTWDRQATTGPDRLVIAPRADQVDLMVRLAETWTSGASFVMYVLVVPRLSLEGRYQCPSPLNRDDLRAFARQFAGYLESDGRHHVWIGSIHQEGLLVYDNHNVIYAYGDLDKYIEVLTATGLTEAPVNIPDSHTHHYHPENDAWEESLLAHWAWRRLPLQASDER